MWSWPVDQGEIRRLRGIDGKTGLAGRLRLWLRRPGSAGRAGQLGARPVLPWGTPGHRRPLRSPDPPLHPRQRHPAVR
ncbi:MAG: hypothetical protein R3F43_09065 [bacterium]